MNLTDIFGGPAMVSESAYFTLPTSKTFSEARSQNVSGNKQ